MKISQQSGRLPHPNPGFTLVELLVVLAVISLLGLTLLPALARSNPGSKSAQCINNHRQLMTAWKMYSDDFGDKLLAAETVSSGRAVWVNGVLDYFNNNVHNYNTNTDLAVSPIWPYVGKNASVFKCPSDQSFVVISQKSVLRVRSYSLSAIFGNGSWTPGGPNPNQTTWKVYGKGADIRLPNHTFTFADEHPDSINDSALNVACTGNQPSDPPSSAKLVDCPASWHNGGCTFSFADGRTEIHKWTTQAIQIPIRYTSMTLNVILPGAYTDLQWLAANTTVHN